MLMVSVLLLLALAAPAPIHAAHTYDNDVVPIDWSQFSGKPTDADSVRIENLLKNASKYAVTTWYNDEMNFDAQTGTYLTFGGTDEPHIRRPADMAYALAVAIKLGVFDPAYAGVSLADAKSMEVKLIRSLAYRHIANSSGGWGDGWQTASWAESAGTAAWLMWDDIGSSTDKEYIRTMVEHEANRNLPVRYYRNASGTVISPGNSGAEENAWNGSLVMLATAMMPGHQNYYDWMDKGLKLFITGAAFPSDTTNSTVMHGKAVSAWVNGSNVNADGTVVNHDAIHPSYMCFEDSTLDTALLYRMIDKPIPQAAKFNLDKIYQAFVQVNFASPPYLAPGGTMYQPGDWAIYYPQKNDKGSSYIAPHMLYDVGARALSLDTLITNTSRRAGYWEDLHADKLTSMQARFTDGHTYLDSTEHIAPIREERAAILYARAYWTKWLADKGSFTFTNKAYSTLVDNGFDYMTTGQAPTGWTIESSAGGTATVEEVPSTANKSVKLNDVNANHIVMSHSFAAQSDTVTAEWKMMLTSNVDYQSVTLLGGTTEAINVNTYNGNLNFFNSSGTRVSLQGYSPNTWYTIKVDANIRTDTCDMYVNGVKKASGVAFRNAASSIDKIKFSTSTSNTSALYIDDVFVVSQ
jgi:hypothetical protein